MSGLALPKTTPRRVILTVDYTVFSRKVGAPPVAIERGQEEYPGTLTHEIPGLMVRVKCDDGKRREGRPSAVRPEEGAEPFVTCDECGDHFDRSEMDGESNPNLCIPCAARLADETL